MKNRLTAGSVALSFALLAYMALEYWLAIRWYHRGLFSFDDGFFDADTLNNLSAIAHGWARRSLVHPHLANFFSIPIRAIDYGFRLLLDVEPKRFRELLALAVSPLSSGVAVTAFGYTSAMIAPRRIAALATLVYAASFAVMVFGAIPEAFAISNSLISVLLCYSVYTARENSHGSKIVWAMLGFLLVSITITNAVSFFLILAAHSLLQRRSTLLAALREKVAFVCAIVLASVGTAYASIQVLGYQSEAKGATVAKYVESFVSFEPATVVRNVSNIGATLVQSFVGAGMQVRPLKFCGELSVCNAVFFSKSYGSLGLACASLLTLFVIGVFGVRSAESTHQRVVAFSSAGIIVFNVALHAVFGSEMLLFVLHWFTPLMLLLLLSLKRLPAVFVTVLLIQLSVNTAAIASISHRVYAP